MPGCAARAVVALGCAHATACGAGNRKRPVCGRAFTGRLGETPAHAVRGGGAAGTACGPSNASSTTAMRSTGSKPMAASTRGGGSDAPAAHHCDTMPPQASIARRTTVRDRGGSGVAGGSGSSLEVDSAATAAGSVAQPGPLAQHGGSACDSQQVVARAFRVVCGAARLQQEAFAGGRLAAAWAATRRSSAARMAASTRCVLAHASRSALLGRRAAARLVHAEKGLRAVLARQPFRPGRGRRRHAANRQRQARGHQQVACERKPGRDPKKGVAGLHEWKRTTVPGRSQAAADVAAFAPRQSGHSARRKAIASDSSAVAAWSSTGSIRAAPRPSASSYRSRRSSCWRAPSSRW